MPSKNVFINRLFSLTTKMKRTITMANAPYGEYIFEVVDYVPYGYFIWNIGSMVEGYLPLCRLASRQPFDGARCIDVHTLKAIKCEGAQYILAVVGNGQSTVAEVERYLNRYKDAKPGTWSYTMVQRMKKALPYMKKIKGL